MLSSLYGLGLARVIAWLVGGFLVAGGLAATLLLWALPEEPVPLNIRWTADVTDAQRTDLERELRLIEGQQTEGTTWAYRFPEPSTASIREIVQHPKVEDTEHINRVRFRPAFAYDRTRRIIFYSGIVVAVGAIGMVMWAANRRRSTASN